MIDDKIKGKESGDSVSISISSLILAASFGAISPLLLKIGASAMRGSLDEFNLSILVAFVIYAILGAGLAYVMKTNSTDLRAAFFFGVGAPAYIMGVNSAKDSSDVQKADTQAGEISQVTNPSAAFFAVAYAEQAPTSTPAVNEGGKYLLTISAPVKSQVGRLNSSSSSVLVTLSDGVNSKKVPIAPGGISTISTDFKPLTIETNVGGKQNSYPISAWDRGQSQIQLNLKSSESKGLTWALGGVGESAIDVIGISSPSTALPATQNSSFAALSLWRVDVFYCAKNPKDAGLASKYFSQLPRNTQSPSDWPRLRVLAEEKNVEAGYQVQGVQVRYEKGVEDVPAGLLLKLANQMQGEKVVAKLQPVTNVTGGYLSVFFCN